MSCLSSTSTSVIAAINVANLANGVKSEWNTMFPASNIPVAVSPINSNRSLTIMGADTTTAHGGYHAVLAIDTGQCTSATCTTGWVTCPTGSCSTSWSTVPVLSWYFDLSDPTIGAGAVGGQFAVVNNAEGSPCLVVFTDSSKGTWFLSAPGEAQAGCAE